MLKPPLPDDVLKLLRKAHPAVMASVGPDGAPVSVATWYLWEDGAEPGHGRVLFNLDAGRVRLRHLRNDPRVSLTVLDGKHWYRHVSLRGRVALQDDPRLTDLDRLSEHYTGRPYPDRQRPRVSAWMTVESYHVWPPGDW